MNDKIPPMVWVILLLTLVFFLNPAVFIILLAFIGLYTVAMATMEKLK